MKATNEGSLYEGFTVKTLILYIAILAVSVCSHAQTRQDGTELLKSCARFSTPAPNGKLDESAAIEAIGCSSLVRGVMETLLIWETTDSKRDAISLHGCISAEIGNYQAIRVVTKYLNDHPEKLHLGDTVLIRLALTNGFPCKT
jgi:hypothetical protein